MSSSTQSHNWELERLRVLYALARRVLLAESLRNIASAALEGIGRLLAPWRSSVGFIDEQREHFTVYVAHGSGKSAWEPGISVPLGDFGADLSRLTSGHVDIERDLRVPTPNRPQGRLGSSVLVSQMIAPIMFEGELVGTLNVGSDQPDAFAEHDASLASEVVELMAMAFGQVSRRDEIIDARQLAESRSQVKSTYLANMTHEIRTPLNAVIGASGLLKDRDLPEDVRPLMEIIHEGGEQLLSVVSNVLDLSKLEAGGVVLENRPFSLRRVLRRATALVDTAARRKGLKIVLEAPQTVPDQWLGDDSRLGQVLTNLLSNAVKFTATGHVRVQVAPLMTQGTIPVGLDIGVEDTGEGVPPERRTAIFEPFAQTDPSTTRRHGGTGLGLPICRELVRMMGGELTLESTVGEGSRFMFSVLLELDRSGVPQPVTESDGSWTHPAADERDLRPLRVLVAEDNPVNQRVLQKLLERLGCRADLVGTGGDAVAAVESRPYDLVLMDVQMPGMDGPEASRRIRELGPAKQPRIVALTASATTEQRKVCLGAGMDDFITKPIRGPQLRRVLVEASRLMAEKGA